MRYTLLITFVINTLLGLAGEKTNDSPIRLGSTDVEIEVVGCSTDSLHIMIETCPIFSGEDDALMFPLKKISSNTFAGRVELEQNDEMVGVLIENGSQSFGFPTVLWHKSPVRMMLMLTPDGQYSDFKTNVDNSPTPLEGSDLSSAYWDFRIRLQAWVPSAGLYKDWHKVQLYNVESLTKEVARADDVNLPLYVKDWWINSLKMRGASLHYIPYAIDAKHLYGISVEEPPIAAYSWLGTLDYSPNMLKHFPEVGLRPFLSTIVRFMGGGLEPIGDTPVSDWEKYAAEKLAPAIESPTPLLLNLLSAMSYILQIENERKPLNPVQIQNIKKGYGDDLDKIILSYNKRLEDELKKVNPEMQIDLTDESFSLKQFIDSKFPGKPVVVDTWNTWCSPCLNAMQQIAAHKDELPKDIVYLYLCDTSSEPEELVKMSAKISGYNVQISKQDSDNLGLEYNLEGFPSYLFFNADHSLRAAMTGFPGLIRFKALAEELSATIAD